jgi:hypothetical protein
MQVVKVPRFVPAWLIRWYMRRQMKRLGFTPAQTEAMIDATMENKIPTRKEEVKYTIVSCESCRWESPPLVPVAVDGFRKLGVCADCLQKKKVRVPYKYREIDTFYVPTIKGH